MRKPFRFGRVGRLRDGDLELVLVRKDPADPVKRYVPQYHFEMRHPGRRSSLGAIRLRIGSSSELRYPGNIGYEVKPQFRGQGYALRSCRLLWPLIRAHGLRAVWFSVQPWNLPSLRICEQLGAEHVETVRIPKDHEMSALGIKSVRRYRLRLGARH